jgi:predicted nucleic acid-binding protein
MAKVTSKYQVTVPRRIAERYHIHPGDDIEWVAAVARPIRGCAAYQLSWFDAHLWSYAEHYGLAEILSEDFQHDRLYGAVRVANPFIGLH